MTKTIRPSVKAFRHFGWLPANKEVYDKFMNDLTSRACKRTFSETELLPPIRDFKNFIETDATVYQEFVRMFEGVEEEPKNHTQLLQMLNIIFRQAPYYGDLGPPMYMIMARLMNTQGGFSAFTKDNLNRHFKKLFETWATFLDSKDSRYVLVNTTFELHGTTYYGWFHEEAKKALMTQFAAGRSFEQVFICDAQADYHGYTSFDHFFNRQFREVHIDRPLPNKGQGDDKIISSPCESMFYHRQENAQMTDDLFIKDEAYSLKHLLANDPLAAQFEGGSVMQGFLNTTGYHRWHAPVTGKIVKIIDVPGTYFAQAPSTIGDVIPPADDDKNLPPYLKSLRYFSNVAARQVMFIQAENPDIGLIFFISIGMTEISTCQATVYDGQTVQQGDELGMFHFGGSSFAMGFRGNSKVKIDGKFPEVPPEDHMIPIKINEAVASVNM